MELEKSLQFNLAEHEEKVRSLQEKVIRLERTIAQREVEANFLIDGLTEVEGENTRILVLRPATDLDINITSSGNVLSARRIVDLRPQRN